MENKDRARQIVSGYKYDFKDPEEYVYKEEKGLNENVIKNISKIKKELQWVTDFRLKSLGIFNAKKMPTWGADLSKINFDEICYYIKPTEKLARSWEEMPDNIKKTWDRLGIPEAERKFLSGVGVQYDSETVYHKILKDLALKGVVFVDPDIGLNPTEEKIEEMAETLDISIDVARRNLMQAHEKFKEFFSTVVPPRDNKFAALNSSVFSGGSFIYVPKGVKLNMSMPLQAYFRINASNMGQFERTLIIADEDSEVSYLEGCTAPVYSKQSLHAAVVEVVALRNAKVRYTTIQNWSSDVYNLVTKRAVAYENATVEWVDCNLGSSVSMKYPSVYLVGKGAKADMLSVAYAGRGQHQDVGNKAIHAASETSSRIISKSVSKDGGKSTFRALVRIEEDADNCKTTTECSALLLDEKSKTDTIPTIEVNNHTASANHEASVGRLSEEALFYLQSRGLSDEEARAMIVLGFLNPIVKTLPLEYAIEFNKLIEMSMEGSVG
ncbi:Fe-S cluster assembly protein SufB [Candidatus Pacearchaeota archaeon]|nr:Fe-S cluster assembly protein SufB [Candidatus Pacearchaeota archaeon]